MHASKMASIRPALVADPRWEGVGREVASVGGVRYHLFDTGAITDDVICAMNEAARTEVVGVERAPPQAMVAPPFVAVVLIYTGTEGDGFAKLGLCVARRDSRRELEVVAPMAPSEFVTRVDRKRLQSIDLGGYALALLMHHLLDTFPGASVYVDVPNRLHVPRYLRMGFHIRAKRDNDTASLADRVALTDLVGRWHRRNVPLEQQDEALAAFFSTRTTYMREGGNSTMMVWRPSWGHTFKDAKAPREHSLRRMYKHTLLRLPSAAACSALDTKRIAELEKRMKKRAKDIARQRGKLARAQQELATLVAANEAAARRLEQLQ